MVLDIAIDKSSNIPIYRQFIDQLTDIIQKGEIKAGDRLPTEREMSNAVGISRGTVKKAYEQLSHRGMVEAVQGRGTFVIWEEQEGKADAGQCIRDDVKYMQSKGFSYNEMKALINVILEKEHSAGVVNIASIDCNPETLEIFSCQVSADRKVRFYPFLLEQVHGFTKIGELFQNFDLVFTTTTHFEEVKDLLEGQTDKIIKAAVSPDMETIVGLAGLTEDMQIGILTETTRFAQIIRNNINRTAALMREPRSYLLPRAAGTVRKSGGDSSEVADFSEGKISDGTEDFKKFLEEMQMLIMPPFYALRLSVNQQNHLLAYCQGGGRIITFHYTIERGSLIYLTDRISQIEFLK